MSELPTKKAMTLRYIPDIPANIFNTIEFGGMYATAPESIGDQIKLAPLSPDNADSQKWQIVPSDGKPGYKIQSYFKWDPKTEGIPPVGLGSAWQTKSPAPETPVMLSKINEESGYYINFICHHKGGWVISITPMGIWIGVDRFIGAPDNKLMTVPEPIRDKKSFPGWLLEEVTE